MFVDKRHRGIFKFNQMHSWIRAGRLKPIKQVNRTQQCVSSTSRSKIFSNVANTETFKREIPMNSFQLFSFHRIPGGKFSHINEFVFSFWFRAAFVVFAYFLYSTATKKNTSTQRTIEKQPLLSFLHVLLTISPNVLRCASMSSEFKIKCSMED